MRLFFLVHSFKSTVPVTQEVFNKRLKKERAQKKEEVRRNEKII